MPHPTPPHPCLHAHNGTHRDESTYLASSHERYHMPHPTPPHPPNVHENARPDKDRAPTTTTPSSSRQDRPGKQPTTAITRIQARSVKPVSDSGTLQYKCQWAMKVLTSGRNQQLNTVDYPIVVAPGFSCSWRCHPCDAWRPLCLPLGKWHPLSGLMTSFLRETTTVSDLKKVPQGRL